MPNSSLTLCPSIQNKKIKYTNQDAGTVSIECER